MSTNQTVAHLSCCPSPHHPNDAICGHDHTIGRCLPTPPRIPKTGGPGQPHPPGGHELPERVNQLERQLHDAITKGEQSTDTLRLALATQLLEDGYSEPSAFVAQQINQEAATAPVFQQSLVIRQHALTELNLLAGANEIRKTLKKLASSVITEAQP